MPDPTDSHAPSRSRATREARRLPAIVKSPPAYRAAPDPSSCDIDLTQFDLPFSPEWKFGVNVTRDFDLSGGALVSLNGNLNYQSEAETDVFNGQNTQMEERTLLGAAVTYLEPDARWSATLYGSNLTDEIYRVAALPVAGLWNFTNYGMPRQIGVQLNLKVD